MTIISDDITLTQIRAVMEHLAKEQNIYITQLDIRQVRETIGRGSNGTIGAYVKEVKLQEVRSKQYDRTNISTQLKSSLLDEIDRFVINAKENSSEELEIIGRDNNELRDINNKVEREIAALKQQIIVIKDKAEGESRRLTEEIVKQQQKVESLQHNEEKLQTHLDTNRNNLNHANEAVNTLTMKIGGLEADLASSRKENTSLGEKIQKANDAREEAERKTALSDQAAGHYQQTINLLTEQKTGMEQQNVDLKTTTDNLTSLLGQLQEKLDGVTEERINDLQKMAEGKGKGGNKSK